MVLYSGSVCLFNCDQNGRDLPEDNNIYYSEGKPSYPCCKYHYFIIISRYDYNSKLHSSWSKLDTSKEKHKIESNIKLCIAIPIDQIDSKDPLVYGFEDLDFIQNTYNKNSSEEIRKMLEGNNFALCNRICQVNLSKLKNKFTLFYLSPDCFDRIKSKIDLFLEHSKKELESHLKSDNLI